MQDYANSKWLTLKTIFIFIVVLFVAYLPVSSFLYFIKNDAFTGYFPPKFFMSESIHSGYLPLWNPYINYGIPQYGDMSGGYWNPITWLVASTVGYNAWTFTLEIISYLLIGGLGMWKLATKFSSIKKVAILSGIAYMCCGYNVGHLQHVNWLCGAAFLPWCVWGYANLQDKLNLKNSLTAAVAFYFLLASAHPGIIIGALYFFAACGGYCFFSRKTEQTIVKRFLGFIKLHGILLLTTALLCTGMIVAYLDFIPHFSRGEKIDLQSSLLLPTTFQSWISFILPFTTVKNDSFFDTDISMRNVYFSLTMFIFFTSFLFRKKERWQIFLLITGILFLLLSTGGFFKSFAYKFLPLIGYVRLNGEFRIFSILCFIILAASELHKFAKRERKDDRTFYLIYYIIEVALFAGIVWSLIQSIRTGDSIITKLQAVIHVPGFSGKFKAFIDALSFYDTIWMQGTLQLLILWSIKFFIRHKQYYGLLRIAMTEIVLATLLNVPFTGAGKASVADVQKIINKAPAGITIPRLIPLASYDSLPVTESAMVGPWSFYNKQPGVNREAPYPIKLKSISSYLENLEDKKDTSLLARPFIFLEKADGQIDDSTAITIERFTPNDITLNVKLFTAGRIVVQQSIYPKWNVYVDGKENELKAYRNIFLSSDISPGTKKVVFVFKNSEVVNAMIVSLVIFIVLIAILAYLYFKRVNRQLVDR